METLNWKDYFKKKGSELDRAKRIYKNIGDLKRTSNLENRLSILNQQLKIQELDIYKKLESLIEYAVMRFTVKQEPLSGFKRSDVEKSLSDVYSVSSYLDFIKDDLEDRNMQDDFYRFIIETPPAVLLNKILFNGGSEIIKILPEAWLRRDVSSIEKVSFRQYLEKEINCLERNYTLGWIRDTAEYKEIISKQVLEHTIENKV